MNEAAAEAPTGSASRFRAFISYSHADTGWGEWLTRRLETYRLPASLVGTHNKDGVPLSKGLGKTFRDRDELDSGSTLDEAIRRALEGSENLVVICSPAAARSSYVNAEIIAFKRSGRGGRVHALIVGGEPNADKRPDRALEECLPKALRYALDEAGNVTTQAGPEVLAADARRHADGKRRALLKLIAGILRVDFDLLYRRDQRRRQRQLAALAAVALAAVTVIGVLGWQAWTSRREATARGRLNRHDAYAAAMKLSEQAHRAHDATRTLALLAAQQPSAGAADLREFAWRYFWRLYHAERASAKLAELLRGANLAVSADGRTVAVAGKGGPVVVLDDRGKERYRITGHGGEEVTGLAFLRDGTLVTAGTDGTVRFWQAGTPHEQRVIEEKGPVRDFLLSADGARLVTDAEDASMAWKLHDLAAGSSASIEQLGQRGGVDPWFFADEGKTVAVPYERGRLVLHDARTGAIATEISSDEHGVLEHAAISPDGRTVAMAFRAKTSEVRLLDRQSAGEKRVLRIDDTEDNGIEALQFSPDGRTIILVTGDPQTFSPEQHSKVAGWDVASGRRQFLLEQDDTGFASLLAVARDGATFATAGKDGSIRLWNMDGTLRNVLGVHGDTVWRMAFAARARTLVTASRDGTVRLWDVGIAPDVIPMPLRPARHTAFAFSPDGKRMATGNVDGLVETWSATSPSPSTRQLVHAATIDGLAFSPAGDLLASAAQDGVVRVSDAHTLAEVATFQAAPGWQSVFSFGGSRVVRFATRGPGRGAGELRVWDVRAAAAEPKAALSTLATVVAVSPDGRRLAWIAGYADGSGQCRLTVRDQAAGTARVLTTCEQGSTTLTDATFSPDGRYLAVGGPELPGQTTPRLGGVLVYDLRGQTAPERLQLPVGFTTDVPLAALAFSPHGDLLATAAPAPRSIDGRPYPDRNKAAISVWRVPGGVRVWTFTMNTDNGCGGANSSSCIQHVRFSRDGEQLVVVSGVGPPQYGDHVIAIHGLRDGRVRTSPVRGRIETISLAPHETTFATTTGTLLSGDPVLLWDARRLRVARTLGNELAQVQSIALRKDGTLLAVTSEWGAASPTRARVWDLARGKEILAGEQQAAPTRGAVLSPDGQIAALVAPDGRISLRAVDDGRLLAALPDRVSAVDEPGSTAARLQLSAGGVLANVHDSSTTLWDARTGARGATIKGRLAALSRDGRLAATSNHCEPVEITRTAHGGGHLRLPAGERCADRVLFSPDGAAVLIMGTPDEARLWDAKTGALRVTLDELDTDKAIAAFSPDGRTLATAGKKGTVDLWDPANGRRLITLDGPDRRTDLVAREVSDLEFSADGQTLAVAYADQVRLWRATR